MVKTYKFNFIKGARLYATYSLVFFLLVIFAACKTRPGKIELIWNNGIVTGIQIPANLLTKGTPIEQSLKVALATSNSQPILGDLSKDGDKWIFKPLIPLSPGLNYVVLQDGKQLGNITVPLSTNDKRPEIVAIYPQSDTIPENTLKLYLQFSKPMRTGQALDYITLLDGKDTLHRVFLNLQPELWDTTGTVLTLWLDPGRIKRGLVLNRELGNPLTKKDNYRLVISKDWKDRKGLKLEAYTKEFTAGPRDGQMPDINKWGLTIPAAGSVKALAINLHESLDHYLLAESITIIDANGKSVDGRVAVSNNDRTWEFTPFQTWKAQGYTLKVNARLEDLAGNNLNRVFDRDVTKEVKKDNLYYERKFEVQR